MAYAKQLGDRLSDVASRRQELLDGTLAVIARKGLSGITINDIAAEVGCSHGLFNFHFKTKERLLLAALDVLDKDYESAWQQMMVSVGAAPADRLRAIIDVDFGSRVATRKNLAIWAAFWAESSRVPAYRARCSDLKRRSLERITQLVTELAGGRDLGMAADMVARGLFAISDGCWLYSHVTGESGPADRELGRQICSGYLSKFFPEHFGSLRPVGAPPRDGAKVVRLRATKA